ncbi:hypothetical protein BDY19DRAFT_128207 [Irpex rosettiformis]|uniref:Uncharacterized protein n=1 Tax=Irpex rosettiformis TaxID=378272 RepID=A0ACB8U4Z2_9APHY|nr:hypothetical protein BDY19DRAFT_128207 [Irpex rosettiformis]
MRSYVSPEIIEAYNDTATYPILYSTHPHPCALNQTRRPRISKGLRDIRRLTFALHTYPRPARTRKRPISSNRFVCLTGDTVPCESFVQQTSATQSVRRDNGYGHLDVLRAKSSRPQGGSARHECFPKKQCPRVSAHWVGALHQQRLLPNGSDHRLRRTCNGAVIISLDFS